MNDSDQRSYLPKILRILSDNCNSTSPRLAEVTFSFFVCPEFDDLMLKHSELVMDILVPGIVRAMKGNWESSIRDRAVLVLVIMEKFDPRAFKKITGQALADVESAQSKHHEAKWQQIVQLAGKDHDVDLTNCAKTPAFEYVERTNCAKTLVFEQ
jgi:hypothetical protein